MVVFRHPWLSMVSSMVMRRVPRCVGWGDIAAFNRDLDAWYVSIVLISGRPIPSDTVGVEIAIMVWRSAEFEGQVSPILLNAALDRAILITFNSFWLVMVLDRS